MKKITLTLIAAICCTALFSQTIPQQEWVRIFNGADSLNDGAFVVGVDGSIVVSGITETNPGTFKIFTIKYDKNGVQLWAVLHNTPGTFQESDFANDIKLDNAGNIYLAASVAIGPAGTDKAFTTLKYDSMGVLQWAATHPDTGEAYSLTLNGAGNIYVCGWTKADTSTKEDFTTAKYNSNGVQQWSVKYDGGDRDIANSIKLDGLGNVYITGANRVSNTNRFNHHTVKYNNSGVQQWAATFTNGSFAFTGSEQRSVVAASNIVLDNGNIYVTGAADNGGTADYVTIKYNISGLQQWIAVFNGTGNGKDYISDLEVLTTGEIVVTGECLGSSSNADFVTIQYDAAGGTQNWLQSYNGIANGADRARGLDIDNANNIYVTGVSFNGTNNDFATVKYSSSGIEQWDIVFNGLANGNDEANDIGVDANQNVYVVGLSFNGSNFDYATVKYKMIPPTSQTSIVCSTGEAQYWGWESRPAATSIPVTISTLSNVAAVSPATEATIALLNDGSVWIWNSDLVLTQVPIGCVKAIAQGGGHYMALKADGTVWCWGFNDLGQFGNGTTSIVNNPIPQQVTGIGSIVKIAAGGAHSLALSSTGILYAWGQNYDGQVGDGTSGPGNIKTTPVQNPFLTNVINIAGGGSHSLALLSNGAVMAWGYNFFGQIGNAGICTGTAACNSPAPVSVTGLSGIIDIAAGLMHSLALNSTGQVYAWGDNFYGQFGVCSPLISSTAITGPLITGAIDINSFQGANHSWAIVNTGAVKIWGDNGYCQLGIGNCTGQYCIPVNPYAGSLCSAVPNHEPTDVLDLITITITPNCTTALGIATATPLAGTPPYTYAWSTIPQQTNASATGLVAGTYTVTVTDANGCTGTASVVVPQYSVPLAADIIGNNNDCSNPATYSTTPSAGITYTWTVVNGTPSCATCSTTVVTWTIPAGGTGTITLTATGNFGCQVISALTVFPCCDALPPQPAPGFNVYLNNAASASGATTYAFKRIQINGTYTVSNNSTVTFQDVLVYFGPEAKIVIGNNAALICITTISSSTILSAGCNIMWDGIYLTFPTSSLTVNSASQNYPTIIMDAKNAVVSKNGGNYSITKSAFLNNLKCIVQQNDAATNEVITGNLFISSGTLKPYYTGNTVNTAQRAFIFIKIEDVNSISIGAAGVNNLNIFQNADFGIHSTNSIVNVINNNFQNFTQTGFPTGVAIVPLLGTGSINASITVGGSNASKNTFNNCWAGVLTPERPHMTVNNNDFTNVERGIMSGSFTVNSAKTLNFIENTMTNYLTGITCVNAQLCTLKINNNALTQNTAGAFATGHGIAVQNFTLSSASLIPEIKNNTFSGSAGSHTCIRAVFMRNAAIRNNTITLPQTNSVITGAPLGAIFYGIRAEACTNAKISNNTVQRSATNLPNSAVSQRLYGISVENSPGSKVAKNTLIRMGSGIHALQTCTNSKFYCNTLNNCFNGFFLNNASIGNQGSAGTMGTPTIIGLTSDNDWTDLAGGAGDRILYQIPSPSISWFYRSNPASYVPTSGAGATNLQTIQINFNTSSGISGCNIQLKSQDAQEREEMFGGIVRDEKTFANHEQEFKIHEKEIAFRELKEDGWLQLGAPDDSLFQNFVDFLQFTNTGKLDDVRKAIEQNDLLLAESKNNAIIPTHLIEENRKTVNGIYLQTVSLNKTEFDLAQTAILESIACQDPLEGGDAVYSARVMLRNMDPCQSLAKMAFVNDEENDQGNETLQQDVKSFSISKIYPNPANDKFNMHYRINEKESGWLEIYDVMGKLVIKEKLLWNKNRLEINGERLNSGVYFYETVIDGKSAVKDKLLIIKQ